MSLLTWTISWYEETYKKQVSTDGTLQNYITHAKDYFKSIKHLYYFLYKCKQKLPKSKPIYNHTISALGNVFCEQRGIRLL
jgi:hypothetical protein